MKLELNNKTLIPNVGLGTWRSSSEDVYNAVLSALKAGYRHIDTAMIYGNEEAIGKAIKDSNITRSELFITTKLWNTDQGYESAHEAFNLSLQKLGLEYVDLYLIHWFKGYEKQMSSWKALEEIYKSGRAKAIGVSNHNVHHIENILRNCDIQPMVNQIETHITLQNEFLVDFCTENNIIVEAYAPLMSSNIKQLLEHEGMNKLANKYNKSVPQIAIKWLTQRGIVALPKSVTESRIISNFNIFDFEISQSDMELIRTFNTGKKIFTDMDNVPY